MKDEAMHKLEAWPEMLNACLDSAREREAEWGKFDCCLFPADAVQAMTGIDCAAKWRGGYHDAEGAYRIVLENGGTIKAMLERMAAEHHWTRPQSLKHLQRGDICVLSAEIIAGESRFGGVAGICIPGNFVAFVGQRRLLVTSLVHVTDAWRIE